MWKLPFERDRSQPQSELEVLKWRLGLQTLAIAVLAAALALSAYWNARAAIAMATRDLPVRVIPGAAAGVYAPGLTEENILNAIRYVQQLGANLTSATAKARLGELERYCAPAFLPTFQAERARLLEEIGTQGQSRAFVRDGAEKIVRDAQGVYSYQVAGPWEFRSGTLVMSAYRHEFRITFKVGYPDEGNRYGIQLLGYDAVALEGKNQRLGAAATPGAPAPEN